MYLQVKELINGKQIIRFMMVTGNVDKEMVLAPIVSQNQMVVIESNTQVDGRMIRDM